MTVLTRKGGLCAAAAVAMFAGAAQADVLLLIDLSVANEITISSTGNASSATVSGSDGIGVYFDNFYGGSGDALSAIYQAGNITNTGDASDGSPSLFRAGGGSDSGLNMWSWATATTVSFTAGQIAFEGSATWSLDANEYLDMVNGMSSGDLYFPADDISDLPGATVIGQYSTVPAPGVLSLAGLGLGMGARRRRRS